MNAVILPHMNGTAKPAPTAHWLQASVQAFFVEINWDDHPPELRAPIASPTADSPPTLTLDLSVGRFFAAINWDGNAIAAPTAVEAVKPTPQNEFTLDDFSDLF